MQTGDRLGRYLIVSSLGAGGMGEVYRARDTKLHRDVALKVLPDSFARDPDRLARFTREAQVLASLNHPNIAQIYGIEESNDTTALVMELVEGEDLSALIAAPRHSSLDDTLHIARQIADALESAHARGVIHRDLKPANIKVRPDGTVKVLDFGLAKAAAPGGDPNDAATLTAPHLTELGAILGTAAYMSPEQAQGQPLDQRSDLFSFGAVLYELLSGRRPFTGGSTLDVLSAVVRDEPPPLSAAGPVSAVVRRCLRKRAVDRYTSATELREALQAIARGMAPTSTPEPPSIAVLPFANMSGDKDQEYFSDGLAEEIINLLAHVPGLKVTARTSAFAFRGKEQDITKIADVLRVRTVLEGSVRRAGNRIRVTAQLINAADGYHIWSERYDRELTDVFAIQDEIAAAITGALQLKLGAASPHRHMPTMGAYEAYLKYRYYQWSFTPDALRRSRECLEQAIALDPKFALPYVGLADHHFAFAVVGARTADETMPKARELAERALAIDPDLPEAHGMLGIVAGQYDLDWNECRRRFDLALAHEPISVGLREWHATFNLLARGQAEEARQHMALVVEQDPLSQIWYFSSTHKLLCLGLDDLARSACQKAVELDPGFWWGRWQLGMIHATQGRHDEAKACAERAFADAPWSPFTIGLLAGTLAADREAQRIDALLETLRADAHGGPVGFFCYDLARGDADRATEALAQAVENRFAGVVPIVLRPFSPRLRHCAGWAALLQKANLTS